MAGVIAAPVTHLRRSAESARALCNEIIRSTTLVVSLTEPLRATRFCATCVTHYHRIKDAPYRRSFNRWDR